MKLVRNNELNIRASLHPSVRPFLFQLFFDRIGVSAIALTIPLEHQSDQNELHLNKNHSSYINKQLLIFSAIVAKNLSNFFSIKLFNSRLHSLYGQFLHNSASADDP